MTCKGYSLFVVWCGRLLETKSGVNWVRQGNIHDRFVLHVYLYRNSSSRGSYGPSWDHQSDLKKLKYAVSLLYDFLQYTYTRILLCNYMDKNWLKLFLKTLHVALSKWPTLTLTFINVSGSIELLCFLVSKNAIELTFHGMAFNEFNLCMYNLFDGPFSLFIYYL